MGRQEPRGEPRADIAQKGQSSLDRVPDRGSAALSGRDQPADMLASWRGIVRGAGLRVPTEPIRGMSGKVGSHHQHREGTMEKRKRCRPTAEHNVGFYMLVFASEKKINYLVVN